MKKTPGLGNPRTQDPKPQSLGVVDAHVHIQPWWQLKPAVLESMKKGRANFDELMAVMRDPKRFLAILDAAGVEKAVLINYPSPDLMGFDASTNEFVADYCKAAPDRLIPCGGILPRMGGEARAEVDRCLDLGIRMFKVHPPHMLCHPNDYQNGVEALAILYDRAQEAGVPVMVHTGTSIFPGARSKYGDPLGVEDVAIDFPRLKIILAHGGRPLWADAAVFLVRRFPNVFMDVSSIPPKNLPVYFPRLEELAGKVLFGTDWPAPGVPGIAENLRAFRALPYSEKSFSGMLHGNAERILGVA